MKKNIIHIIGTIVILLAGISVAVSAREAIDRTILPIQVPNIFIQSLTFEMQHHLLSLK